VDDVEIERGGDPEEWLRKVVDALNTPAKVSEMLPQIEPEWRPSRSCERLIEVMRTVNLRPRDVMHFDAAAAHLGKGSACRTCICNMIILEKHESPHIAELAREALYYFRQLQGEK
jgi:hypothetical protein